MIFSSGQILALIIIGGFFVFAIINRICSCVESKHIAKAYREFLSNKLSNKNLDQSLEEFKNTLESSKEK